MGHLGHALKKPLKALPSVTSTDQVTELSPVTLFGFNHLSLLSHFGLCRATVTSIGFFGESKVLYTHHVFTQGGGLDHSVSERS